MHVVTALLPQAGAFIWGVPAGKLGSDSVWLCKMLVVLAAGCQVQIWDHRAICCPASPARGSDPLAPEDKKSFPACLTLRCLSLLLAHFLSQARLKHFIPLGNL